MGRLIIVTTQKWGVYVRMYDVTSCLSVGVSPVHRIILVAQEQPINRCSVWRVSLQHQLHLVQGLGSERPGPLLNMLLWCVVSECVRVCVRACVRMHGYESVVSVYTCTCACTPSWCERLWYVLCMYVYMCVCVCTYIHTYSMCVCALHVLLILCWLNCTVHAAHMQCVHCTPLLTCVLSAPHLPIPERHDRRPQLYHKDHKFLEMRFMCDLCHLMITSHRLHCDTKEDYDLCLGCYRKEERSGMLNPKDKWTLYPLTLHKPQNEKTNSYYSTQSGEN